MTINILTLFPPMFENVLSLSIVKRAQEKEAVNFSIVNIRDFSTDNYKTVDNHPYGGGPGMVMMVEPIDKALESIGAKKGTPNEKIVLMSAKGNLYNQAVAKQYSTLSKLTLICGHYEGVDERVSTHLIDEEVRVGDYVLTGGELPAMIIADSVIRLLPGVLGDEQSPIEESHAHEGYLEYPHYTRPSEYKTWKVPEVLLNGNHKEIEVWRQEMSSTTT